MIGRLMKCVRQSIIKLIAFCYSVLGCVLLYLGAISIVVRVIDKNLSIEILFASLLVALGSGLILIGCLVMRRPESQAFEILAAASGVVVFVGLPSDLPVRLPEIVETHMMYASQSLMLFIRTVVGYCTYRVILMLLQLNGAVRKQSGSTR